MSAVILASTALAVVLAVALAREVRLRRALESLLRRILAYRRRYDKPRPRDPDRAAT